MPVAGGSIQKIVYGRSLCALGAALLLSNLAIAADADPPPGFLFYRGPQGSSSKALRDAAIASLPTARLTSQAQDRIMSICKSPTIYRRMPIQAIDCDRNLFLFLARKPEVMVGIWELMGITKVKTNRTGPYQLDADDGSGTKCTIDLVYGDPNIHVFVTEGSYDGMLTARALRGKGVIILKSDYAIAADGRTTVTGTMDLFMQVESLGLDLLARTLSTMIGRAADYNYVETARFVGQIYQASERNPPAMIDLANRMPQVNDQTRQRFIGLIQDVAAQSVTNGRVARQNVSMTR